MKLSPFEIAGEVSERMWITPLEKYASQNAPEENALGFFKIPTAKHSLWFMLKQIMLWASDKEDKAFELSRGKGR